MKNGTENTELVSAETVEDDAKALVVREPTPGELVQQAIDKGVTAEAMEKFVALYERWEARQARDAFVRALTDFQSRCPIVTKTEPVMGKADAAGNRKERYRYAPLPVIVKEVGPLLHECGLSYTIDTEFKDGLMYAICKVTHVLGHSETTKFMAPIDAKAFMNEPQKYASARTYASRYAFCGGLGILTADEDDDANSVDTSLEDEKDRNPEPETHHHGDEEPPAEEPPQDLPQEKSEFINPNKVPEINRMLEDYDPDVALRCRKTACGSITLEISLYEKAQAKELVKLLEASPKAKKGGGKGTRPTAKAGDKCPDCGGLLKLIPAGTSKKTGKDYGAFIACESYDCKYTADAGG